MPVEQLRGEIARVLRAMGVDELPEIELERPRNPEHGDFASNVAMLLAKPLRRAPRQIADEVVEKLDLSGAGIRSAEVAGPGFINFRLTGDYLSEGLAGIVRSGADFGRSNSGEGQPVVVEFVSANPTGPLHIGHGRQAALGDSISELLAWCGWKVQREYYYNDAGEQIARLARSVWARYQQHFGREIDFPEDGYHGSYVTELAGRFAEREGDRFVGEQTPEALEAMRLYAVAELRAEQNDDLDAFGVHFDHFFLESSLYDSGRVEETIRRLRETGLAYEKDGALWLRTTDFGDDKDRVMVKSTGHPTYFLPDVAYHVTKWERGFHRAINVQGSDHHGTVARVRAGLQALGLPEGFPEYVLHQMVTVMRGGEEVKFSKRAGDYVTLRDLVDEVGADVTRFFFLMRRSEAQLTFDLDLALDQSEKNPVYKLQYAHARMSSIFRRAGVDDADSISAAGAELGLLDQPAEQEIVKLLLRFPEVVATSAERHTPHSICEYLEEVGGAVNSWYHAGNLNPELRVFGADVPEAHGRARLVLARAIQIVLANGLSLLGVSAPERMERAAEIA
jgi:arginyl-tRNA synthetase